MLDYYKSLSDQYADQYGVPRSILQAVIGKESGWNPNAMGKAGEIGLGQLMPNTAREMGVNPFVPRENLQGSAKFLAQQFKRLGNWRDALSYYNAGFNLENGRGYADSILSKVGGDILKDNSNTPILDSIKKGGNPAIAAGGIGSDNPGGGSVLDEKSGFNVKELFSKFGLWILAGFLILIGIWKVIK